MHALHVVRCYHDVSQDRSLSFILFVDPLKSNLSHSVLYISYDSFNKFVPFIPYTSIEGEIVGLKSVADITLYHITLYSLTLQALSYCLPSLPSLSPTYPLSLVEM